MNSPYKIIKSQKTTQSLCPPGSDNAFRYQATPCVQVQQTAGFEFVSAFCEDKKPGAESLDHAYRQNRMACSSALRHLDSLNIMAPVFGLLWASGKVKAHVDWCQRDSIDGTPVSLKGVQDGKKYFNIYII